MGELIFDERGFGTSERRIRWEDVHTVGIRTTDTGPFTEDLFWLFLTSEGPVELPGALVEGPGLEPMLTRLPGWNHEKLLAALSSTRLGMFRIWHADAERLAVPDARLRERFSGLIERLGGLAGSSTTVCDRLLAAWREPHRRYHTLEHLLEGLLALDRASAEPGVRDQVELPLWFHDAVYQPAAKDNEERSAALLVECAGTMGLPPDIVEAAARAVRATAHVSGQAFENDAASSLLLDIDLSILAADPVRFMEYEYAVAEEYAHVAGLRYELGRGRLLRSLLAQPTLFRTEGFRERLEARARSNLGALLSSPRYRRYRMAERVMRPFHGRPTGAR